MLRTLVVRECKAFHTDSVRYTDSAEVLLVSPLLTSSARCLLERLKKLRVRSSWSQRLVHLFGERPDIRALELTIHRLQYCISLT